uniref:Actin-related protein 8-like n=1 Tax=Cicer arietinum TaxID=3827 RepID=A0A3Q7YFG8_CICAR|nr:actin-related protein 8-like [Cicer arietinum]
MKIENLRSSSLLPPHPHSSVSSLSLTLTLTLTLVLFKAHSRRLTLFVSRSSSRSRLSASFSLWSILNLDALTSDSDVQLKELRQCHIEFKMESKSILHVGVGKPCKASNFFFPFKYVNNCSSSQCIPPRQFPLSSALPDTESARASRRQLKEAIYSSLFDMNVPAVCAVNQATLALYAAKRTSGIVVNIGFQVTSVVPILNGKVMRKVGVEVLGLGAMKLTGFLKEKMQLNNLNFQSLYTVRALKENLCYVALDYEAELLKENTQASFQTAGDGWFTLSKERFQTAEILFKPHLSGMLVMGLHQAIAVCMEHCHSAELTGDSDWYKTVVLSGGTACLAGILL